MRKKKVRKMKNWTRTCFRRELINDREVELKWKGKALLPTESEIRIMCSKQYRKHICIVGPIIILSIPIG